MSADRKEQALRRHLRGAAREERRQRRESHKGKKDRKRESIDWGPAEDGWRAHEGGSRRPERARKRRADTKHSPSSTGAGPAGVFPDRELLAARVTGVARDRALVVLRDDRERTSVSAELAPGLRSQPLTVGDHVEVRRRDGGSLRIETLLARTSVLSRVDPGNAHRERLIAANVDLGVIVASATAPPFRPGLIDRFLIALERGGVDALLCINKIDLCASSEEVSDLDAQLESYRELGLEVLETSVPKDRGIAELRDRLGGKTSVFVGHSGVGKSSILSALAGSDVAQRGSVRAHDGRGRHTTTSSSLFELDGALCVIDTPGIRAFGLHGIRRRDLSASFPGFEAFLGKCRYGDCTHQHEPGCAVRRALEEGALSAARYAIYTRLMGSLS